MPVLEVEGLSKSFRSHWTFRRRPVIRGLDLEVEAGEVFGFLGPNGAGKTTTLRAITGILRPTSGRISVSGFDVVDRPVEAKRCLALVPDAGRRLRVDRPQVDLAVHTDCDQERWLGHATVRIETSEGKVIYIDPWLQGNPLCLSYPSPLCSLPPYTSLKGWRSSVPAPSSMMESSTMSRPRTRDEPTRSSRV